MILLIIFLLAIFAEVLLFIYLPKGNYREIILIAIGAFIGVIGFSIKDSIKEFSLRKKSKRKFKEVCNQFNSYFERSVLLDSKPPKNIQNDLSEDEILEEALKIKHHRLGGEIISILKLCYYCKKWEQNKTAEDYEAIKRNAESLGIKYAKIDNTVRRFSELYFRLILQPNSIDLSSDFNSSSHVRNAMQHFINNYYKDLQFFEIKDKFHQNKNLHETLIKVIKEGKLSTFGITNETIKKLEKDLSRKAKASNVFVIFTNNTNPQDRQNLKDYLHSYSRLGMAGGTTKMPIYARFGVYIIKTETRQTAKSLLKDIKNNVKISSEAIVRIVPLNLIDSETYTLPFNQSFTNENLQKCYEALEWFKTGYDYSDSALWSEITKSNITPDELLSVIPFNILCKGILPCEQEFIIKNYEAIKRNFNVNTLSDWAEKDQNLLKPYMLQVGVPEYSNDELKIILGVEADNKDEMVGKRILKISKQIIDGAKEFKDSLTPVEL